MTELTEGKHALEFLESEASGARSREAVTLTGGNYKASQVVAKVLTGTAAAVADGGNTGDGAMGAITVGAEAVAGDYVLEIVEGATDAGQFQLTAPDGDVVGIGNVGAAFDGGGLSFTLADGATDFAVGDKITITVAAGSGKYVAYDSSGVNGEQIAAGILCYDTDASTADVDATIIARDAEVNADELGWGTEDANGIALGKAHLAALGIIARAGY